MFEEEVKEKGKALRKMVRLEYNCLWSAEIIMQGSMEKEERCEGEEKELNV